MTINEYQKEALRTANVKNQDFPIILNGVLGLAGESGECADLVKKAYFQGHPLVTNQMAKELGDVAWYLAETAYALGVPLEEVCSRNIEKLRRRFPEGFSEEKSIHRAE